MRAYRVPGVGSAKGFLVKEYGLVSENVANRTINGDTCHPPLETSSTSLAPRERTAQPGPPG